MDVNFFIMEVLIIETSSLTFSWRRSPSYRNQSIKLQCKSMDCFLYDKDLRHTRFICSINQWIGFYVIGTSVVKELNLKNLLRNKEIIKLYRIEVLFFLYHHGSLISPFTYDKHIEEKRAKKLRYYKQ